MVRAPGARRRRLVTIQVLVDVTLLTLVMWSSGGYRSGIPILILIALAGAGLVGEGRMVLFYAAYATVAVLLENIFGTLWGRPTVDFFTVGITCIGFFAIAEVARLLALRAAANEKLARQRGVDLASQLRLNRQIIQDMQDGVLVVGREWPGAPVQPPRGGAAGHRPAGGCAAGGLRAGPGPGPAGFRRAGQLQP